MSYLLQLPRGELPTSIRATPYVIFAIQGEDISGLLPSAIPLNMVLHFAPKMSDWIVPIPKEVPEKIAQLARKFDLVGINIPAPVHPGALLTIFKKMAADIGVHKASKCTLVNPDLMTSLAIARAWETLGLPSSGSDPLRLHIFMTIMSGPSLTLAEMKEIWETFDPDSSIMDHTATSFAVYHVYHGYSGADFDAIIRWVAQDDALFNIFHSALDRLSKKRPSTVSDTQDGTLETKNAEHIAKKRQRAASVERQKKERADFEALQRRLARVRGEKPLRSVTDPD